MSQSVNSAFSCKSCSICQDIMKQLQQHISTIHQLTGQEGVIANVIINLLSLMVSDSPSDLKQLNQTVPVISKPPDKQTSIVQESENTLSVEQTRSMLPSFPNEFTSHQMSGHIMSSVSEMQASSHILPLSTEAKIKDDHANSSQSTKTLQQISNLLEFPLMIPQGSETESIASNLVNADGTLTPVGISLLLSNQTNRVNTGGKSDLDDVADILVNKMPIPSLKGLDSNFQQLSNFYLQQLALSQLQAFTNTGTANVDHSSAAQNISADYGIPKDGRVETFHNNSKFQLPNSDHTGSLQQLLERHKQISGRIDALNSKLKNDNSKPGQNVEMTQKVLSDQNMVNVSGITTDMSLLNSPRNVTPTTNVCKKQKVGVLTESSGRKTQAPIMLSTNDNSIFLPSSKSDVVEFTTAENVHFSREKRTGDVSSDNVNNIQSLILETVKRIQPPNFVINKFHGETNQPINVSVEPSVVDSTDMTACKDDSDMKTDDAVNSGAINSYVSSSVLPKLLYKCEHCGVTFGVLATLTSHIKNMHSDKVEFCNYCQISFTNQQEFYTHLASHKGEEKIYNCQFCDKIFTSNGDFKKHVIKHTQKRPYSCGHCQKSFRDPGSLAKHERIHTGEQPFICEICHRGFAEKSSLRKHSRVHSGEKPYKCQLCDKSFSISGNLQRHMLIHTGKRPFKCTVCSKAFNNPSHLRRHIRNLHAKNDVKNVDPDGNMNIPRSTDCDESKTTFAE